MWHRWNSIIESSRQDDHTHKGGRIRATDRESTDPHKMETLSEQASEIFGGWTARTRGNAFTEHATDVRHDCSARGISVFVGFFRTNTIFLTCREGARAR